MVTGRSLEIDCHPDA